MPRHQQSASRRPKGEVTDFPCEECGALMEMKWSFRRIQWFYGCKSFPACRNAFNAHPKTGAPQPGQMPPELRKPKKAKPALDVKTYWDVVTTLDEEHTNMKYVIGAVIEGAFHYWNGTDIWTCHPEHIHFYNSMAEAKTALNISGGDFIDPVPDVRVFQDRLFGS